MVDILIYTKPGCPYCVAAKRLLTSKGAAFTEIDISGKPDVRSQMIAKANGSTTVPQIFIGTRHVGGSDDIHALDAKGGLDPLLAR
jgi:glutaredoxin 3